MMNCTIVLSSRFTTKRFVLVDETASATGFRPPDGNGDVGISRIWPDSELISKMSICP